MKINTSKLTEQCFVLILLLNLLSYSKYISIPSNVSNLLQLTIYFVFFIISIKDKYSKKSFLTLSIIMLSCILTTFLTNNFVLILSFLMLYMSSEIDVKRMVKLIFKYTFIVIIIHFIVFCYLYIKGVETIPYDINGRVRLSLGFSTYNISGFFVLWCYMAYIYINDLKLKNVILGLILVYITYIFNDCRTALLCSIFAACLAFLKNKSNTHKYINFISRNIIIISTIFLLVGICLYTNNHPIGILINKFTNERIRFASYLYNNYNITIFGQYELNNIVQNCDNTYSIILYRFGVVFLFIFDYLIRYVVKKDKYNDTIMVLIWGIFANFENACLTFVISFPILLASTIFLNNKERIE